MGRLHRPGPTEWVGGDPHTHAWVPKDGTKNIRGTPMHLDVVLASEPAVANLDPLMVAIGTDSEIDTPWYDACPRVHRVDCKSGTCRCIEHQHSDHKLLVWGAVGKLKPAMKKRLDQFRWKLGDLLENKERHAAYEQCCAAEFEALASEASDMTTTAMEVAFKFRGLLT